MNRAIFPAVFAVVLLAVANPAVAAQAIPLAAHRAIYEANFPVAA